mgnify:FL=1
MNVVKRDGRTEEFDANKIHEVLFWATKDIKGVSVSDIEINAKLQVFDGIKSVNIHQLLIQEIN